MSHTEKYFESRSLASDGVAKQLALAIEQSTDCGNEAVVIASGGTTPAQCYEKLAQNPLSWEKVHILPSDERCVPLNHEARNESMIRRTLMTRHAATANLVSIYDPEIALTNQCAALDEKLESLPYPFTTALLGMGEDGHFASLFPDNENLKSGLDPDSKHACMQIETAGSEHPRMSLTMSTILHSKEIYLLFFGVAKYKTYQQAKLGNSSYPISALLQQQRAPVHVYWAE